MFTSRQSLRKMLPKISLTPLAKYSSNALFIKPRPYFASYGMVGASLYVGAGMSLGSLLAKEFSERLELFIEEIYDYEIHDNEGDPIC